MDLVTGATGHIGNALVRELLSRGREVRALVRPWRDCTSLDGLDIQLVEGDILDPISLRRAFAGIEDVYHLAGMISIMPGRNKAIERVNLEGTRYILEAARESGVHRLVYTSSIHAYRRVPHGITIDERLPFDPEHAISSYDWSKAQASLEVLEACRQGLDAVIASPTGVIGPYDYRISEMGAVILGAMQNKPQLCVEGAYDFVDARDVATGLVLACQKGSTGESYLLSGEQMSVKMIIASIQGVCSLHSMIIKPPLSLAYLAAFFAPLYYQLANKRPRLTRYALATVTSNSNISHAKASQELGYAPRSLEDTLKDTIQWFRDNRSRLADRRPKR